VLPTLPLVSCLFTWTGTIFKWCCNCTLKYNDYLLNLGNSQTCSLFLFFLKCHNVAFSSWMVRFHKPMFQNRLKSSSNQHLRISRQMDLLFLHQYCYYQFEWDFRPCLEKQQPFLREKAIYVYLKVLSASK